MNLHIPFNDAWSFAKEKSTLFETVRIPHTVSNTSLNYFDESVYQNRCIYKKKFIAGNQWKNSRVFLVFGAVAHVAIVYLNGRQLVKHSNGYTSFSVELTDELEFGCENEIIVQVSGTEEDNVPPFGHVVDYMTYCGIYRPVSLDIKPRTFIDDIFVSAKLNEIFFDAHNPEKCKQEAILNIDYKISDLEGKNSKNLKFSMCRYTSKDLAESLYGKEKAAFNPDLLTDEKIYEKENYSEWVTLGNTVLSEDKCEGSFNCRTLPVCLWDVTYPAMYLLKTEIYIDGVKIDEKLIRFAFRSAMFKNNGFYLNGRKFKIRGLNRHQSFPYVGYAMPKSMQTFDAEILKNELFCNAVRTSHYPQSQDFIDKCDELGLLVFMEFPGWQYIGDDSWKEQALKNLEEMIVQFRNHPSIILWGVRINESIDCDDFYRKTNKLAHRLDISRQTGGVRASKKSHLFEDVYTYNDFSYNGTNDGCEKKSAVTSDASKPYLVTEYNGHMFPTKIFDNEDRRVEHAIRHIKVLDAIAGNTDICGSFGWCMFDYNTHKDFGSGDRICYHGVMDMYRNAKKAAASYAMQQDEIPFLEISSNMDIGEHSECIRGCVWIFSNADKVRFYKNDIFIHEYDMKKDTPFKNILHGPVPINDYIGNQIEKNEPYGKRQASDIKDVLNCAGRFGMGHMTKSAMLKAAKLIAVNRMKFEDALILYNKYIGDWGGKSTVFRFEAIKDQKIVKTVIKAPGKTIHLHTKVDHTKLREEPSFIRKMNENGIYEINDEDKKLFKYSFREYGDGALTFDVAEVRIVARDENGNDTPFLMEPVLFETQGPIEIIGPKMSVLRGGVGACYVRTTGDRGNAKLIIHSEIENKEIDFEVTNR
ncbi:glycoside hydrolase family 2 protein [Butyrivibrio sp. NC3005]|uniref:glycoside hydrolase family 2 protein n=1 Tax=Butyrivibrio sp. NC3005 TaxID=1280685 RepID=UPI000401DC0A|nr:glycoside hydrolase family 2 TIM barrel-domain containing protein [Butyrivibrio sp. NC3005]